jgi:hypothetical protein
MNIVYQTKASNTPSIQSSTTALASNPLRIVWNIQNLSTNVLYVLLGTGASSTVFHFVLKAGTAANDGTGGSVGMEEGVIYTGPITVAGTTPSYTALEIAPGALTPPN